MARVKYTLPRHTNLASQGLRITAAVVDFAILIALVLLFYFAGANLILNNSSSIKNIRSQLNSYEFESHLKIKDEQGNLITIPNKDPKDIENALEGFYLRYLPGNPIDDEGVSPNADKEMIVDGKKVTPKEYYTVEYFNKNVLNITQENPDGEQSPSYYTYQKDDKGNFIYDKVGVRRSERYNPDIGKKVELTDTDFLVALQPSYVAAYAVLINQDYYVNLLNQYSFSYQLGLTISILIAGLINYIVLPFFLKNGQTLGKKIFKLGLATYDGYKFSNYQLLLRFVPFLVLDLALLIPMWSSIVLVIMIPIVVLLVSFALMMASPKKAALHDFAARTIVVDLESSMLFANELEEEAYIAKEDGLVNEEKDEDDGEEPELRYERR